MCAISTSRRARATPGRLRPLRIAERIFDFSDTRARFARLWMDMKWINRYSTSGNSYRITTRGATGREGVARVKIMADVIVEYSRHPELKSLDARGAPCGEGTEGLLYRRPVVATHIRHIGKESKDLEDRAVGLVHDPEEVVNLQQRAQRGIRSCRVCRKPLTTLRTRYCSACKRRAFRRRKRGAVRDCETGGTLWGSSSFSSV